MAERLGGRNLHVNLDLLFILALRVSDQPQFLIFTAISDGWRSFQFHSLLLMTLVIIDLGD